MSSRNDSRGNGNGSSRSLDLHEMSTIYIDEHGIWHRPEYPQYTQHLAAPKPFLVPSFDDEIVEVLPSEKPNRKICFDEKVYVLEIENRFQMMEPEEMDDDDSYEIEIVERSGTTTDCDDADFYLEMIDGEIFYVFETEDDISVDECDDEDPQQQSSNGGENSSYSESQTTDDHQPIIPMQLNIGDMMSSVPVPNLDVLEESSKHLDASELLNEDLDADDMEMSDHDMNIREDTGPIVTIDTTKQGEIESLADQLKKLPSMSATSSEADFSNPAAKTISSSSNNVESNYKDQQPTSPERTSNSILRSNTSSPTKSNKKKDKKIKKEKKEKTFTKTFVRVADFDGEHRVYNWEKPTWTNQKLKSTGKGDDIRKGANLANPITDAAVLIEKGEVKWEKPEWALQNSDSNISLEDVNAKEELIRKIQDGSMNLRGMRTSNRRLKLSINGSLLAAGNDIVKPITKATIIKKPSNINYIANPKILRATPCGSKVWNGESLAAPVTQATSLKKYDWEKPSWVQPKLHSTGVGDIIKAGADVAKPITSNATVEWEKPDWTKKRTIGRHKSSELPEMKREYKWEQPSWAKTRAAAAAAGASSSASEAATTEETDEEGNSTLKPTKKGQLARRGENLARPITFLPHLNSTNNTDDSQGEGNIRSPSRTRTIRRSVSDDF